MFQTAAAIKLFSRFSRCPRLSIFALMFESHFNTSFLLYTNLIPQLQFVELTCGQLLLTHMDHGGSCTERAEHPHHTSLHMDHLLYSFWGFFAL